MSGTLKDADRPNVKSNFEKEKKIVDATKERDINSKRTNVVY